MFLPSPKPAAALAVVLALAAGCAAETTTTIESSPTTAAESDAPDTDATTTAAKVDTPDATAPTTAEPDPVVPDRDEVVSSLMSMVPRGAGLPFTVAEVRCWAEAIVDREGLESFADADLTEMVATPGDESSAEDAQADEDVWAECIDSREMMRNLLTEGSGAEMADCAADAASEQLAYEMFVAPVMFDQPINPATEAAYLKILADCGVEGLG